MKLFIQTAKVDRHLWDQLVHENMVDETIDEFQNVTPLELQAIEKYQERLEKRKSAGNSGPEIGTPI